MARFLSTSLLRFLSSIRSSFHPSFTFLWVIWKPRRLNHWKSYNDNKAFPVWHWSAALSLCKWSDSKKIRRSRESKHLVSFTEQKPRLLWGWPLQTGWHVAQSCTQLTEPWEWAMFSDLSASHTSAVKREGDGDVILPDSFLSLWRDARAPRCSLMSHCHQVLWGWEAPAAQANLQEKRKPQGQDWLIRVWRAVYTFCSKTSCPQVLWFPSERRTWNGCCVIKEARRKQPMRIKSS